MEIEEVPAAPQGAPVLPLALADIHRFTIAEIHAFTNGLEKQIGQGGQGRVFRGQMHSPNPDLNGRPIAIKEYLDTSGPHEANHLSRFQHPNIIGVIGVCEAGDKFYLVTPYMSNGDLLSRFRGLGWGEIVNVLRGVALGLQQLHRQNPPLIFRDLKTANILLDDDLNGVLCDFGTVSPATDTENNGCCSFGYADPCYLAHGLASEEVDIYSLGIIILQLVSQWEDVTVAQRLEDNSRIKKLKQWLGKEKDNSANEKEYRFVFWCREKNKKKGHVVHERLISHGCSKKDARAITQLGLDCVHREQSVRPTIDQVIDVLQRLNQRRGCLAVF